MFVFLQRIKIIVMIRKIYYLVIVLLLSVSCRDGESESKPKPIEQSNLRLKVLTAQDISNLQVGQRLKVNFEIDDRDNDNVSYIIRPETENKVFHQRLGDDYLLQIKKEGSKFMNPRNTINVNKIVLDSKQQKGDFYIYILKPGNFQHKYILEKYVNGAKVGETSANLLFNAVKITAWTYHQKINKSTHRRYYKFLIDDGNEQFDNYLENVNGKVHTYSALYREHRHSEANNTFSAHQEKEFRWNEDQKKSPTKVHSHIIDELAIQQKQADGTINNIVYKNITIEEK